MTHRAVLIGMKHCGKSTLARRLAERWGGAAIDTDDLLVERYRLEAGPQAGVREIFRAVGPDRFADLEREIVRELTARLDRLGEAYAVAMGGRTATHTDLHGDIRRLGTVVYLQVEPGELYQRVMLGGRPPFLDADEPEAAFLRLFEQREPFYESLADVTVDLNGLDVEAAEQAVCEALCERE